MLPLMKGSGSHPESLDGGQTSPSSLQEPLEEPLSVLVLDVESQSLALRQSSGRVKGCRKSGVI